MSNPVRLILVVLCVLVLFYLVITLARSVSEESEETGSLLRMHESPVAAHRLAPAGLRGWGGAT